MNKLIETWQIATHNQQQAFLFRIRAKRSKFYCAGCREPMAHDTKTHLCRKCYQVSSALPNWDDCDATLGLDTTAELTELWHATDALEQAEFLNAAGLQRVT
jgi:hypothetical protein